MKERRPENEPTRVSRSDGTKQGGDIRDRWSWVEPAVWTERMLEALENGVKGGKWFSLIDKVYSMRNLEAAWKRVNSNKGSAGIDRQSVKRFSHRQDKYLLELQQEIREDRYQPKPVLRRWIPKPGRNEKRPLGIPSVKDRIAQCALRQVLEPIWEKRFISDSYKFRPKRSCKDALRRVNQLLEQGRKWVVDVDIKGYFENIDHRKLMEEVKKEVADGRVLRLIELYLKQSVVDGMKEWKPEKGTPQGAVISPLLANIYLHQVDKEMTGEDYRIVRYADDMVILCESRREAENALVVLKTLMESLGLELHPEKTRIVDANVEAFEFLGYEFRGGYKYPRKKSLKGLREKIRIHTKRANGQSIGETIQRINPILRGWYEYFKHCSRTTFPEVDGWVRMRLRSILRKRAGRKGRGRGADHQRWPNTYFAERGLFTMETAHAAAIQSR